ncbi:hypothetical protein PQX77_012307 [Marasmius sp. AFHP31]|nr:hypothetical protein PQX77_012307 [Marasmius sp. AFHP31]
MNIAEPHPSTGFRTFNTPVSTTVKRDERRASATIDRFCQVSMERLEVTGSSDPDCYLVFCPSYLVMHLYRYHHIHLPQVHHDHLYIRYVLHHNLTYHLLQHLSLTSGLYLGWSHPEMTIWRTLHRLVDPKTESQIPCFTFPVLGLNAYTNTTPTDSSCSVFVKQDYRMEKR